MEENIFFKEIDGITYTSDMRVITGCKKDIEGHIIIPEGVEIIKAEAFRSCESITSIILPDSLKTIEWIAVIYNTLILGMESSKLDVLAYQMTFLTDAKTFIQ